MGAFLLGSALFFVSTAAGAFFSLATYKLYKGELSFN